MKLNLLMIVNFNSDLIVDVFLMCVMNSDGNQPKFVAQSEP